MDRAVHWTVTVPPDNTALIGVNRINADLQTIDGIPINESRELSRDGNGYRIPSGTYAFTGKLKR